MTPKMKKIGYWVATILFLLPMAGTGVQELFVGGPASTATTLVHLGYPLYLMRILGFAKILGAVAIVSNQSKFLKEWAYAGYTFELLGATASHLFSGDGPLAAAPVVMLILVIVSRLLWTARESAAEAAAPEGLRPSFRP
jgi:hypothetical protein